MRDILAEREYTEHAERYNLFYTMKPQIRCEVCGALRLRYFQRLSHAFFFIEQPLRGCRADIIHTCTSAYCVYFARRTIEERNGGVTEIRTL